MRMSHNCIHVLTIGTCGGIWVIFPARLTLADAIDTRSAAMWTLGEVTLCHLRRWRHRLTVPHREAVAGVVHHRSHGDQRVGRQEAVPQQQVVHCAHASECVLVETQCSAGIWGRNLDVHSIRQEWWHLFATIFSYTRRVERTFCNLKNPFHKTIILYRYVMYLLQI